jgi:hypothetical protein
MILQAEAIYSENRLRALADEWSSDYLNLIELGFFLKRHLSHFKIREVSDQIQACMLDFLINNSPYAAKQTGLSSRSLA